LKLVTKSDESDLPVNACVFAQAFRKDDASVAIDREDLDVAVERNRKLVPLI
jgi:hypothetical protein